MYTVLALALEKAIPDQRARLFVIGALAGLIYSLLGRFGGDLPRTLFRTEEPNMVHLVAPLLYAAVYGLGVYEIQTRLCV